MEINHQSMGEAVIKFLNGPLAGQTIALRTPITTIGRDRQNDITLLDQRISRQHAAIRLQDGHWILENLSRTSYITIDQQRTERGQLQHNNTITLGGEIAFLFSIRQPGSTEPASLLPEHWEESSSGTIAVPEAGGRPALTVSSNVHSEVRTYLLEKEVINIGRNPQNEIPITESTVSALHAQIVREKGTFFFVHPHPSRGRTLNGLWYQGQRISGDQTFRKLLVNGDMFRIGDEYGTLITLTYGDGSAVPQAVLPAMQPTPLSDDRLTIGRAGDNTVVLNHPQISARHALLEKVEGGYRLTDTNSTNHVYVNGQRISTQLLRTGDELRIGPYRLIYTGTELRQYDESTSIRVDALHLKKTGNNQVMLLNDISLVIPPRKFVALVGGSGAGKSTLMDALNGLRPAADGVVLYNGEDYYRNLAVFRTQLGYVPQDDIVHRELTVERALYYAARLRLPSDFTREQIQWRIDEVLEDVEMTERRDLLVSKLSGGQRKRVSIALELLANPSIFFLDEPTSGLDPGLDRKMMFLLRRLADKGHTIVLVTHATNNINSCDYVCFLTQGGRLAYFGPPNAAKDFFEKTDFAEIYSALEPTREQPDIPAQAEARFRASQDYQRYIAEPLWEGQSQRRERSLEDALPARAASRRARFRGGRGWSQFFLLATRYLELLKNDTGNLLILLLQAPVIAVMLVLMVRFEVGMGIFDANQLTQCRTQILTTAGPLALPQSQRSETIDCQQVLHFLQGDPNGHAYALAHGGVDQVLQAFLLPGPGADAQKVLFIMAFATVLFGCINGAREIVKEAPIYRRERTVNLGIVPYMFSKIVVLGVLCLLQSAVLVLVVNLGEPLGQGIFLPPLLEVYITLSLTSLAGLMIGLTISAIAPNNDRAISFVPIILIPQVIFSGAIIPLKDWLTQILAAIFPTRWAMAALGSSIGLHADKVGGDRLFGDDPTYHGTLFSIYSQTDALHRLILSWGALGVLIVLLVIGMGLFLKRKDSKV
jgi:ABC-type multidrug transport system ATPase subunit/pSer/pThr/pTyr-binding forkhead associated (FHA) protein